MIGIILTLLAVILVIVLAFCYSDRELALEDDITNPGFSAKKVSKRKS